LLFLLSVSTHHKPYLWDENVSRAHCGRNLIIHAFPRMHDDQCRLGVVSSRDYAAKGIYEILQSILYHKLRAGLFSSIIWVLNSVSFRCDLNI
jgi:hypothetical protein